MSRVLVLALLLLSSGFLLAGSDRGDPIKTPLDLLAGARGGEEEEDAPEAISFYGLEIEGEGFHFCFAAYEW